MTLDEKQRQKKLARKLANRKAKLAEQKSRPAAGDHRSPAQAARFPIHECLIPKNLFDVGIGHLVLSRALPTGEFALAAFLVDVYCLGVKDAFDRVVSRSEYALYRRQIAEHAGCAYRSIDPACLRKLVEGAVRYAGDLGFTPHADYARTALLFGDIDAAACPTEYAYGKDGRPLYISGPSESPARARKILAALERKAEALGGGSAAPAPRPAGTVSYRITHEPLPDSPVARLPEPVRAQFDALYHQSQKQPDRAVPALLALIEQYPDVPQLYNYLANAYQGLDDDANAWRIINQTIERFPDYLYGRISYANACLDRNQPDKVAEIFEDTFELGLVCPERDCFHISEVLGFNTVMARYFLARGDRSGARVYYKLLQQLAPEHPNTRLIGQLLSQSRLGAWFRRQFLGRTPPAVQ